MQEKQKRCRRVLHQFLLELTRWSFGLSECFQQADSVAITFVLLASKQTGIHQE